MKKKFVVLWICLCLLAWLAIWFNRPDNGVHGLGKNVCLVEGECVVINWDASPREVELALDRWHELKEKQN